MPLKQTENTTQTLPPDWQEVRLGDVSSKIGDGLHGTPTYDILGKIPFINGNNLANNRIKTNSETKKVNESEYLKYSKVLNNSTILISLNGTIGNLALYDNEKVVLSKSAGYINLQNTVDRNYIFFFLQSQYAKNYIDSVITGSTIRNLGLAAIREFPIPLPPLPEQKAIAGILSSLDDKIELLRNQNQTLENLGQRLFEREMEAGGEFEESRLGGLGQIVCGKTPSTANPENFDGKIPFIKIPDMHGQMFVIKTNQTLSEVGANTQKNKFIPANSLCVSCIATVGVISITAEPSQTNQQINSMVPENPQILEWLYYSILNRKSDLMALGAGGAVTLNVNTNLFSNFKIKIPSKPQLEAFHNLVSPLFSKILANTRQIQTLSKIRDTLLPELMGGRRRVEQV